MDDQAALMAEFPWLRVTDFAAPRQRKCVDTKDVDCPMEEQDIAVRTCGNATAHSAWYCRQCISRVVLASCCCWDSSELGLAWVALSTPETQDSGVGEGDDNGDDGAVDPTGRCGRRARGGAGGRL